MPQAVALSPCMLANMLCLAAGEIAAVTHGQPAQHTRTHRLAETHQQPQPLLRAVNHAERHMLHRRTRFTSHCVGFRPLPRPRRLGASLRLQPRFAAWQLCSRGAERKGVGIDDARKPCQALPLILMRDLGFARMSTCAHVAWVRCISYMLMHLVRALSICKTLGEPRTDGD